MAAQTVAKRLQTWIVVCSALGIFTVGVIVAIVSIVPLYNYLKKEEERNLALALNTKTMAVEEYLSRARDVALQITSRTTARERLEDYNEGRITLDEVSEFTRNVLMDAMNYSHEVWSVTRLDRTGKLVVQVGLELPESIYFTTDTDVKEAKYSGPLIIGNRPYLVIITPILNRKSIRVGTDIMLFRLFHLERIVEDYTGLGSTGETMIGVIRNDHFELVFPFRTRKALVSGQLSLDSPLGTAVKKAALMQTGILFPKPLSPDNDVIAYGPIKGVNWAIMVKMDRDELYEPVYRNIWATSHIIVILLLLGTVGMILLVRPLTGKMIIRADELEREVQKKTAELQQELAGRKRMEQWLRDSERRYRVLLEEVPDVIFILDTEGRFTYVNTQVEKFLEYPVNAILETPFVDHVAPEDKARAATILQVELDTIWDEEIGVLDAKGTKKYARIRCKASLVDNALRYEGVMRDITRRRILEEELKASREELLEKIKIIDDLYEHIVQSGKSKAIADHTAEVAHELRQPLAIIGGFARRMARQLETIGVISDPGTKESCQIMVSEIQRLERILKSLIDFTKHERIHLEKVDPNNIIEKVLRIYDERLKEKNIRLESNLDKEAGEIFLDPNRFEQVVRNIISNALEASPPGETITVDTGFFVASGKAQETGGLESEGYFEMKVHNHGKMIPPEDLQKIFSPFYTTKDYGTGVGLTISKKIIEEHKGSISVKSDIEGTVFTIWLPLNPVEKHESAAEGSLDSRPIV